MKFRLLISILILHNLSLFSQNIKNISKLNPNFEILSLKDSSSLLSPYFTVQIGTFKQMIDSKNPITKYPLSYYKLNDTFKYFVGKYMNYSSALRMKELLNTDGNTDVFIVCYGLKSNENTISNDKSTMTNEIELNSFIDTAELVIQDTNNQHITKNIDSLYMDNYSLRDDTIKTLSPVNESLFQDEELNFENAGDSLIIATQVDTTINNLLRKNIKKINLDSIRKIDSIKVINDKIQKFISLTNPSDPEQFMSNITYLDPKLRTSSISDSSEFEEVFYTIQLGAYSKPLTPPNFIFKFKLYMSEHNSLFKYCHGKFESLDEAKEKRDEFQLFGIYDAFIISYGIPSKDSYLYDSESKKVDFELDSLENSRIEKIISNDPDVIFYSEKDSLSSDKKISKKEMNEKSSSFSVDSINLDTDLVNNLVFNDSLNEETSIKSVDNELLKDSLDKEITIKSVDNELLKDSIKDLKNVKNLSTDNLNASLYEKTYNNNYRIIDLDYQVPNVYYIELGVFKVNQNTIMDALKVKLPFLNVSSRKRFTGFQYYTKKFNSLLNAQKALDEIYENEIINARIIKSTSSQYKNNYEFRVLIDVVNSINSKKIQDKIYLNYKILKGNYRSRFYYFSKSRDDYNDVLNDKEFFIKNDFSNCKVVVFQNGKESTIEKANMEQKY